MINKLKPLISLGVVGALVGFVIGEFFPRLFDKSLGSGIMSAIGGDIGGPFSSYRNELALKYGLIGLGIGAVIGIVIMVIKKK